VLCTERRRKEIDLKRFACVPSRIGVFFCHSPPQTEHTISPLNHPPHVAKTPLVTFTCIIFNDEQSPVVVHAGMPSVRPIATHCFESFEPG